MAFASVPLLVAIGFLMVDALLEMAFISDMVGWLHRRAGKAFEVFGGDQSQFSLHGKPLNLLVDQGHTSNGAGGTAFVLIGLGGLLVLYLRHRQLRRDGTLHGFTSFFYKFWLVMTVPAALLTLAAFIYTFVVTYQHDDQNILIALASTLNNQPYPNYVAYPAQTWTPETWLDAVLNLPLVSSSDRSDINMHLNIIKAWRWNLIPLTNLSFLVCGLAFLDYFSSKRRTTNKAYEMQRYSKEQHSDLA